MEEIGKKHYASGNCVLTGLPVQRAAGKDDLRDPECDGLQTNVGIVHRDAVPEFNRLVYASQKVARDLSKISMGVRARIYSNSGKQAQHILRRAVSGEPLQYIEETCTVDLEHQASFFKWDR